jgi:hypothetical protein
MLALVIDAITGLAKAALFAPANHLVSQLSI